MKISQGHHLLLLVGLTVGFGAVSVLPASAANVKRAFAIGGFLVQGNNAQISGTFDFDAHPPDMRNFQGGIVAGNPPVIVPELFDDKHGTVGIGVATFSLTPLNMNNVSVLIEAAEALINPSCDPDDGKCGGVAMTTTTGRGVTVTVDDNEKLEQKFALDIILNSGTELSLGETGGFSESISVNGVSHLIYDINFGIVKDPLTGLQKVDLSFNSGSNNSYFSYLFDSSEETIKANLINAFTYDNANDTWTVNQDTNLFSVTLSNLQSVESAMLEGASFAKDPGIESVPEPTTILGSATALGFGALLKRGNSQKQNKS